MKRRVWRHNSLYMVYVFGLVCLILGEVFATDFGNNTGSSGFGPAIVLIGAAGFFLSIAHPIIASAEYAKRFPSIADQRGSRTIVRERLVLSPRVNELPPRVVLVASVLAAMISGAFFELSFNEASRTGFPNDGVQTVILRVLPIVAGALAAATYMLAMVYKNRFDQGIPGHIRDREQLD
jgi:hypothetical protein